MIRSGIGLSLAALVLLVAAPSVSADVARARKPADAAKVASRLEAVGLPASTAAAQAASLTAPETAFFAADPSRVQVVGGLTTGEWLGSLIILGFVAFIYFGHVSNQTGE